MAAPGKSGEIHFTYDWMPRIFKVLGISADLGALACLDCTQNILVSRLFLNLPCLNLCRKDGMLSAFISC